MRDRLEELGANTVLTLVTFSDGPKLTKYVERHDLDFPVLSDPNRDVYRAFGLGRGSIFRQYGWKAARRYAQIIRADGFGGLRLPTDDTLQLGGDFVVDSQGQLAFGYWSDGPDDRPSVDALIDAVYSAAKPRDPR